MPGPGSTNPLDDPDGFSWPEQDEHLEWDNQRDIGSPFDHFSAVEPGLVEGPPDTILPQAGSMTLLPLRAPALHPADLGLSQEHLDGWKRAERALRCPIKAVAAKNCPQAAPIISPGTVFHASNAFTGTVMGYVFKLGDAGLGYYWDAAIPQGSQGRAEAISPIGLPSPSHSARPTATPIFLEHAIPPPVGGPLRTSKRKSRRARHLNGLRCRRRRRAPRIDNSITTDCDEPHFPIHTQMDEHTWRSQGIWAIDTVNSSSFTSAEANVLPYSAADCMVLQETKRVLSHDDPDSLKRKVRRLGWSAATSSAIRTALGKSSGGCIAAAKRGIGVVPLDIVHPPVAHRLTFARIAGIVRGGFHLGSIWLRDSEGMSESNRAILDHAASSLGRLRGPWIIGGDWNLTPEVLAESGWLRVVGGFIVAPQLPTCNGKVYDFWVVCNGMRPAIAGIQRIDDAGLAPHYPTRLLVRGGARRFDVRQMSRPAVVPGQLPDGPLPGPTAPMPCNIHTIQELDDSMRLWQDAARTEWRSLIGALPDFRAPSFKLAPAPGPRAEDVPDSSRLAQQWRTLAMRSQELASIACSTFAQPRQVVEVTRRHLLKMQQLVAAMAKRDTTVGDSASAWLLALLSAHCCKQFPDVWKLQHVARLKAQAADSGTRAAAQKAWRNWIRGGSHTSSSHYPTKRAFNFVRGAVGWTRSPLGLAELDDDEPDGQCTNSLPELSSQHAIQLQIWSDSHAKHVLSDQAAVDLEATVWATEWGEHRPYSNGIDDVDCVPPPALIVDTLRSTAMTFPVHTGLGADNVSPRAFARLSDELLLWLCLLYAASEKLGHWPSILHLVMIVLIPKPDGGRRPIGLFPTAIRIWMRARSDIARRWENRHAAAPFYGGKGMGAQRAAWMVALRAEVAAHDQLSLAQALLDLVKAFERIPHHLVAKAAKKLGYCLCTLRLSLAAYRLPRVLGADGAFSRLVTAVLGITAGAGHATLELRLIMHEVVTDTLSRWPLLSITLYVDDATLEAVHSSRTVVLAVVAAATDYVVNWLQQTLQLEVSVKKSVVVGSSHRLAADIATASRTRTLTATRSTKLLGVGTSAGRTRCVKFLKVRINTLKKRIPRIHCLRRSGISAKQMTRAAGTPLITYGADIAGMANTHLLNARRTIAKAIAPEAGGKNFELVLYLADGANGTCDPAFAAHTLPMFMWAMAHWDKWTPTAHMHTTLLAARDRVVSAGTAKWNRVTGPAAALAASLHRIGWQICSGCKFLSDDLTEYDVSIDPPTVITQAVQRSVRRWRLASIAKHFPQLIPASPDIAVQYDVSNTAPVAYQMLVLDFPEALDALVGTRARGRCKHFDQWSSKYRGDLKSAFCGGQWPQARLFSAKLADCNQCQLCLAAVGTLEHRLVCPHVRPFQGWQPPPADCRRAAALLNRDQDRVRLASTRAIACIKIIVPRRPPPTDFQWLLPPPDDLPAGSRWFIDGSMFDEAKRFARRTGYGVVVVSAAGELLGFGAGEPPAFIVDAAGAELWAYYVVLSMNASIPATVTDCRGILDGLAKAPSFTTDAKQALARTWSAIRHALDDDYAAARRLLVWMPSHQCASNIHGAVGSDGCPITPVMWRANRLADVLAKSIAGRHRLPRWVLDLVRSSGQLVQYFAARLGTATHAANNYLVTDTTGDGSADSTRRDSTAKRPHYQKRTADTLAVGSAESSSPATAAAGRCLAAPTCPGLPRGRKRASTTSVHQLRRLVEDEAALARCLASKDLRPAEGPTAAERMARFRLRMRCRV